jgi:hypothetical protein
MEPNQTIPAWLVFLAGLLAPKSHREYIRGDLLDLCTSAPEYRQRARSYVIGAAAQRTRDSFHILVLAGEVGALCLPVWNQPLRQVIPYAAITAFFLRLVDIYTEDTEGTPLGMTIDWVAIAVFASLLELTLAWLAPSFALTLLRALAGAVLGGVLAAAWRLVSRQMEPNDPRFKKLKESNIATWHMNVLFIGAAVPIMFTNIIAVPDPGHNRDQILGILPLFFLMLSYRLQTGGGIWRGPRVERYDIDTLENRTLKKWFKRVWAPDQPGRAEFPVHILAEIAYFASLLPLVVLAWWRWYTGDPLAAQTDWRQLEINIPAIAALAVLWIRIKKVNLQLQKALALEIRRRKESKDHERSECEPDRAKQVIQ